MPADPRGLVEQVARMIAPHMWAAFDVEGRDGRKTDKADEVLILRRARLSTLSQAREIVELVGGQIEQLLVAALDNRLPSHVSTELQEAIAAEFKRKVTEKAMADG